MPLTRGQRLRRLREQKGVEQQVAAPAIGISRPYLSLLERDEKGRNVDHVRATLGKAARYYGVIPEYLLVDTPQEYIRAFIAGLGASVPYSSGTRLELVLGELQLRWGDEFALPRLAETMGTTPEALEDFMNDRVQITDTVADQLQVITGAPADWLVPRAAGGGTVAPEIQRLLQLAMDSGVQPAELEILIHSWLVARKMKTPSGV